MTQQRKPGLLRRFLAPAPAETAHILSLDLWPVAAYAVGDVHGCFDLYQPLEARLNADAAAQGGVGLLVVLGDFIDRGPQSARMLDHLLAAPPPNLMRVVLRGNHEEMFLRFLDAPDPASDWLHHGGLETLASYGLETAALRAGALSPRKLHQTLGTTIPSEHRDFLRALPDALILSPLMFVHAGVDPACPPEQQKPHVLRWGAPEQPGTLDGTAFPLTVVHGHIPSTAGRAEIMAGRVNLDTGAYARGTLSAARFLHDGTIDVFEQTRA